MSFDLYFLSRQANQTWGEALEALEEHASAQETLSESDLELWGRLKVSLRDVLPELDEFEGERNRELSDDGSGIQISLFPQELSLTVPYWYSGPEADRLVGVLRRAASIIERESGLTAYDPQAGAPFLAGGDDAAAATFNEVHASFAGRGVITGTGELPPDKPASRWRRLLGGR